MINLTPSSGVIRLLFFSENFCFSVKSTCIPSTSYYGGSSSSKNKKKETPKTKTTVSEQIDIFGGDGNENK